MPNWVLVCAACKTDVNLWPIFPTNISEFFLPAKPVVATQGLEMRCPKCGHDGVYKRTDILYRAR